MSSLLPRTATHATATHATTIKSRQFIGTPLVCAVLTATITTRYDTAASGRSLAMSALSVAPSGASMAATACGSPRVRP